MSFKVIKAGFLSTIQDYGRWQHHAQGMSLCGAADEHAYCWANYLLNNHFNHATLEIALGAVELEAQIDTFISVTGADLDFKINTVEAALWCNIAIKKGDRLTWGYPKKGVLAYLAVKNGFNTDLLFGSRSVNLRENIGSKLHNTDVLPCSPCTQLAAHITPELYIPDYNQALVLRLLPSYQFDDFNTQQHHLFFNQNYQISTVSNRTGCRLNSSPIPIKQRKMISEGISYGSVEIASDGLPIILLKDAPTIGGYPKIGTVFSLDLAKLSQRPPNTQLRFEQMKIEDAQAQRLAFNQFFNIL